MGLVQIPIGDIAELGTKVAMHGALGTSELGADDIFEVLVGIIALVISTGG